MLPDIYLESMSLSCSLLARITAQMVPGEAPN